MNSNHRLLLLILCFLFHPSTATTKNITISNLKPRTNITGEIMDAHDGTYNQWEPNGPWYYYAMGYGTCKQNQDMCNNKNHCGYGYSWIGIWKSKDLSNGSWELIREARDATWPKCTYFRVHTIYNKNTKKYIMWANLNGCKPGQDYAIGTSNTPDGPFTFVHSISAGRQGAQGGDFDIFVDEEDVNNSAYLIYTAVAGGHTMSIELLTDDYLSSAYNSKTNPSPAPNNVTSGVIGNVFVEAPAMFKRKEIYYALFGNCCCFCGHGSGIGVYTSLHPLGPWEYHRNVGCESNVTLSTGCGCGMDHSLNENAKETEQKNSEIQHILANGGAVGATCNYYGDSLTTAQQNFVIRIKNNNGSTSYVWTGDRWQSSKDGIKGHDLQYWSVLEFVNVKGIDLPVQFVWEDEIVVHVQTL